MSTEHDTLPGIRIPELLIFFITATADTSGYEYLRGTVQFDLWQSDSVTQTMFAACIYSSSAVAGSTSEGRVLGKGGCFRG